jgi:hypothetical protein
MGLNLGVLLLLVLVKVLGENACFEGEFVF